MLSGMRACSFILWLFLAHRCLGGNICDEEACAWKGRSLRGSGGLLEGDFTAESVLSAYEGISSEEDGQRRYLTSDVLGFITPWHRAGQRIAVREARRGRIQLVSPVM